MNKEAMFEEISRIMQEDMAPTMGCTGPISYIFSAAAARELAGGTEVRRVRCQASGKFCARMGEVVTPGLPEDSLEIACAAGAVAGITAKKFEVIKDITPEETALAQKLAHTVVEVIPDWDAPELVYMDTTVETEEGTGRVIIRGGMLNIVYKEKNGEVLFSADYSAAKGEKNPISKYTIADLYTFCHEVPMEKLAFLRDATACNVKVGKFGMEHDLGAGLGYHFSEIAKASNDPIDRVKAICTAACEARMVGIGMKVLSISNKGNLGIATILPTYALAQELGKSEEEAIRAVALACLLSIRISVRIGGGTPIFCSCLLAACQAAAAGYVMLHGGDAAAVERAIQNCLPATFGACCDGPRNACAMRMIAAVGTGYDAAKLALLGVEVPVNEGMIGVTSEDTVDVLEYMSGHLDEMNTALMKKIVEKRPLTPPTEKKTLPAY